MNEDSAMHIAVAVVLRTIASMILGSKFGWQVGWAAFFILFSIE